MKGKDIYTGTIKKCTDLYNYNKYGEEHYVADFRLGHSEIGTLHKYVDVIDEKVVLIKINEGSYIEPSVIRSKFFLNLGIYNSLAMGTSPCIDGETFVDEKTLEPLFKDDEEDISIEQAKSLARTFKTMV